MQNCGSIGIKTNNSVHKLYFNVLLVLTAAVLFNSTMQPGINQITDLLMMALSGFSVLYLIYIVLSGSANKFFKIGTVKAYGLFFLYQVIISMIYFTPRSLNVIAQSLVIFAIFAVCVHLNRVFIMRRCFLLITFAFVLAAIDCIIFRVTGKCPIFSNPNKYGIICFLFLAGLLLVKKRGMGKNLLIILVLVISLLSRARTALLVNILLLAMAFFTKHRVALLRKRYIPFYVVALALLFVYIYVMIAEVPFGIQLNDFIFNLTGKGFFSGRQRIWGKIIQMNEKPFFGYGGGILLQDMGVTEGVSSHNQFLELWIQYGVVGLLLFINVVFSLWKRLFSLNKDPLTPPHHRSQIITMMLVVIGLILFNSFEVFWIQNHFNVSIMIWILTAGVALGGSARSELKKRSFGGVSRREINRCNYGRLSRREGNESIVYRTSE